MPKAPDGNVYVAVNAYGKMVPHGASICSTNENIVETVKWLDWHYSEEATTLYNWGIEGQSYEVVDGKKQFTDLILNNPDGLSKDEAAARYAGGVISQMPIVEDPEVFLALKSLPQQKLHLSCGARQIPPGFCPRCILIRKPLRKTLIL